MFEAVNNRYVLTLARCLAFPIALTPPVILIELHSSASSTAQADLASFSPFFTIFVAITFWDYLVGLDRTNAPPRAERWLARAHVFRLYPLAVLPIQVGMIVWGASVFASFELFSWVGRLGWTLSVGLLSGFMGITAAHELIHRSTRVERTAGGLLLSTVCFGGFKVEHILGHHVNVATPLDASSARYDQSLYHFLPRAYYHNTRNAWILQRQRLVRRGQHFWSTHNELLWWYGASALVAVSLAVAFGPIVLLFFFAQSFVAITLLEIVNYIEHYGLRRRLLPNGHYESVAPWHSWNASYLITNLFLFQLQRHSDHHANASRRYQVLRHVEDVPQLPGGYSAMVPLALVPPLWRRVMNPRVQSWSDPETVDSPAA